MLENDTPSSATDQHLLTARRRAEEAVAAALAELLPASRQITVTVGVPDSVELAQAQSWLADGQLTAADASRRLGVAVAEPELVGWVSQWPVSAQGLGTVAATSASPATDPATLAVDLADWLQQFLADGGVSAPTPPCPHHPHPMRPVVHQTAPWWACPGEGLVRAWAPSSGEPFRGGRGREPRRRTTPSQTRPC